MLPLLFDLDKILSAVMHISKSLFLNSKLYSLCQRQIYLTLLLPTVEGGSSLALFDDLFFSGSIFSVHEHPFMTDLMKI